ncbi:Hypothetical predicted protein [Pelobates cultripes]|uniref:exodeoxyribonuclease III n=1 Tax=Pelobates cultripes TaxID=61616 RepID=A0AAD1W868_PELCU|nr:Hypothetical predicted protein [Pelobates cultripes]
MLQETHFKEGAAPKLRSTYHPISYCNNHPEARRAGVAILLAANLGFQELDKMTDEHGRFLFIKGVIAERVYTFATIYVPNSKQAQFLRGTLNKLHGFSEGALIVGGDFKAPLDPLMDSSTGHSCLSQAHIRSIRRSLGELTLVDCWRAIHPTNKDYTHYLAVHNRYSRIDYLMIRQEGLSRLQSAAIEPATWSDHGSVQLDLESPLFKP